MNRIANAATAATAALFLCAGTVSCGSIPTALDNITETQVPVPVKTAADGGGARSDTDTETLDDQVAKVGEVWKYDDGVEVQLTKIESANVPEISAGGHPGDPAVIVTVKVTNNSDGKLDMSQLGIEVRTGADGIETDRVFAGNFDNADGTLAKGRSYTFRAMYAADKSFKKVAVDVSPTWEHTAAQFEDEL